MGQLKTTFSLRKLIFLTINNTWRSNSSKTSNKILQSWEVVQRLTLTNLFSEKTSSATWHKNHGNKVRYRIELLKTPIDVDVIVTVQNYSGFLVDVGTELSRQPYYSGGY